ncbi:hypothetical protein GW17_00046328 [Ensete ventricosum]|nr:hypothetical protein GW17_00046328 [Ensete ventricosum]
MHSLRFPNSGIRPKCSEEEDIRPAIAKPPAGAIGHGLAPARWRLAVAKAPCKGATCCGQPVGAVSAYGHGRLQHDARKGGRLQGGARKGLLARGEAAGAAPTHGQAARVGCPRRGHRGNARPPLV